MAEVIVQEESLVTVADAIREKTGGTDGLVFPTGFAEAISGISGFDALIERSLTEISSNVTNIGDNAFNAYDTLTAVNFPSAISIGEYAFSQCKNLTDVNLPAVNTIKQRAFQQCSGLTSIEFPNVTSIGSYTFYNCTGATKIKMPKLKIVTLNAFNYCTHVTTADFPSVTSVQATSIQYCYSLTALILRSETMATLANKNALTGCYHILGTTNSTYNPNGLMDGYIYVPSALVASYQAASNWSNYASQFRALEDYTVDGTITGELDETKI